MADVIARALSIATTRDSKSLVTDNVNIMPIFKNGKTGNYRLVSLTSGPGKVREHILLISTPSLPEDKKEEQSIQLCLGQTTLT